MNIFFGLFLQAFGQFIQNIGRLVNPTAFPPGGVKGFRQSLPKPK
jgi:hypothetical protein